VASRAASSSVRSRARSSAFSRACPSAGVPLPSPMKPMKLAIRRSSAARADRLSRMISGRCPCRRRTSTSTRRRTYAIASRSQTCSRRVASRIRSTSQDPAHGGRRPAVGGHAAAGDSLGVQVLDDGGDRLPGCELEKDPSHDLRFGRVDRRAVAFGTRTATTIEAHLADGLRRVLRRVPLRRRPQSSPAQTASTATTSRSRSRAGRLRSAPDFASSWKMCAGSTENPRATATSRPARTWSSMLSGAGCATSSAQIAGFIRRASRRSEGQGPADGRHRSRAARGGEGGSAEGRGDADRVRRSSSAGADRAGTFSTRASHATPLTRSAVGPRGRASALDRCGRRKRTLERPDESTLR